jgi:hypothetical protein
MKKKILVIGIVVILISMLVVLTGCGENNKESSKEAKAEEKYSELIVAVRENTNSKGHKIGDIIDYAIKDGKWEEEYYGSSIERYVKVTGTDKETGDEIVIAWNVSMSKNGVDKIEYAYFKENGEDSTMLGCAQYLNKYESEMYN